MSCFYCKQQSKYECQKVGCNVKTCGNCKNTLQIGGEKWIECQNAFNYYCQKHYAPSCMYCKRLNSGCGDCQFSNDFTVIESCCVCEKPYCYCNDCEHKADIENFTFEESCNYGMYNPTTSKQEPLVMCFDCGDYCCKGTECSEMVPNRDEFSGIDVSACHKCAKGHFMPGGWCHGGKCWRCKKK